MLDKTANTDGPGGVRRLHARKTTSVGAPGGCIWRAEDGRSVRRFAPNVKRHSAKNANKTGSAALLNASLQSLLSFFYYDRMMIRRVPLLKCEIGIGDRRWRNLAPIEAAFKLSCGFIADKFLAFMQIAARSAFLCRNEWWYPFSQRFICCSPAFRRTDCVFYLNNN